MSTITHRRLLKRAANALEEYANALKDSSVVKKDGVEVFDDPILESIYQQDMRIIADLRAAAKKIKRPGKLA